MGILRIYLALCVVAEHSTSIFPWQNHRGKEAVQIFYLISGFYMAHIAGKYKSVIEFYLSRFFRIFPVFNVADSCVCVGAFFLFLIYFKKQPETKPAEKTVAEENIPDTSEETKE